MSDNRYKRDALVQAWIDRRYLATIINGMYKRGESPTNLSQILKEAIKRSALEATSGENRVEFVELTEDANSIIDSCLRINLNRQGKGLQNLRHNTMVDRLRLDRVDASDRKSREIVELETGAEMIDKKQLLVDSGLAPDLATAEKMVEEHDN